MLTTPAEQLRAVDHRLPRRDRAELRDHPAGIWRLLVRSAQLADGGAGAAARIGPGERTLRTRRIERRRPAGLVHSWRRTCRLALAGDARERCGDHRPRAGHTGPIAVPRSTAADAILSMPKL